MPLIPSHQGLIAPLWWWWPKRFNIVALCIGAAMPDAVDVVTGLIIRGKLGQWYGHTLLGLHFLCVPFGLLILWGVVRVARKWSQQPADSRWTARFGHWVLRYNYIPADRTAAGAWCFLAVSMWVGAFSHMFFDLISHGSFKWLAPWYTTKHIFPEWWHFEWAKAGVPFYRDYPIGPHFLVWLFLSVLGLVLLFGPWNRVGGRTK